MQLGALVREVAEQHRRAHDEHARVPAVLPRREVALRGRGVGLLREAAHVLRGRCARDAEGVPAVHVPERRRRPRRRDADRHDVPGARGLDRLAHGPLERVAPRDDLVGRERPDDDVAVPLLEDGGREPDRRHGVARGRFGEHVLGRETRELRARRGDVPVARDEDDALLAGERDEPVDRRLEQRPAGAREVEEELGRPRPGERPQPRARASRRDDGVEAGDRRRGRGGRRERRGGHGCQHSEPDSSPAGCGISHKRPAQGRSTAVGGPHHDADVTMVEAQRPMPTTVPRSGLREFRATSGT